MSSESVQIRHARYAASLLGWATRVKKGRLTFINNGNQIVHADLSAEAAIEICEGEARLRGMAVVVRQKNPKKRKKRGPRHDAFEIQAIVEASYEPGCDLEALAHKHGVTKRAIYVWRYGVNSGRIVVGTKPAGSALVRLFVLGDDFATKVGILDMMDDATALIALAQVNDSETRNKLVRHVVERYRA